MWKKTYKQYKSIDLYLFGGIFRDIIHKMPY